MNVDHQEQPARTATGLHERMQGFVHRRWNRSEASTARSSAARRPVICLDLEQLTAHRQRLERRLEENRQLLDRIKAEASLPV